MGWGERWVDSFRFNGGVRGSAIEPEDVSAGVVAVLGETAGGGGGEGAEEVDGFVADACAAGGSAVAVDDFDAFVAVEDALVDGGGDFGSGGFP